jgi:hypothetical protein
MGTLYQPLAYLGSQTCRAQAGECEENEKK